MSELQVASREGGRPDRGRPDSGSPDQPPAADLTKLVELADLYRIPLWILAKPFYAFAPASFFFRAATLRGTVVPFPSAVREVIRAALDRHLPNESRASLDRIERRHRQFVSRVRFARQWPQVRNFTAGDAIEVAGLHHLDDALQGGRGALVVAAHFGHARLIRPILNSHGRSVVVVGSALPPGRALSRLGRFVHTRVLALPRFSRFDERCRQTVGEDLRVRLNVRPLVAVLERNETLMILADGRKAQALTRTSVLGVDVHLAPGALSLARSTGAAALPVFVVDDSRRGDPIGIRMVIHAPLELQVSGDVNRDLEVNLQRFAAVYEDHVRSHPHNWFWSAVRDGRFEPQLVER